MESIISTNQNSKALVQQKQQQRSYSHDVSLDCSYSLDESGWTLYLEDFNEASSPSKKGEFYGEGNHNRGISFDGDSLSRTSCERMMTMSCKRRKTKAANYVDLDLEDTATSPDFSLKGETNWSNNIREEDEKTIMDLVNKRSDHSTDLRRKGLCLVPLSMLFNCVS